MNNYGESNGDLNVHEKQVEGHDHCENGDGSDNRVILGIDGGTTSTVCVCIPLFSSSKSLPNPPPILGRAVSGCSNHNSVGGIFVVLFCYPFDFFFVFFEWWI
jgi:hypothetical protein